MDIWFTTQNTSYRIYLEPLLVVRNVMNSHIKYLHSALVNLIMSVDFSLMAVKTLNR